MAEEGEEELESEGRNCVDWELDLGVDNVSLEIHSFVSKIEMGQGEAFNDFGKQNNLIFDQWRKGKSIKKLSALP